MKNLFLVSVLLTLFSCRVSEENPHAYYKFDQADQSKLLNHLTVGKVVKYNNQEDEVLTFTVQDVNESTSNDSNSPMFGDKWIHLDQKTITLANQNRNINYHFVKRPVDYDLAFQQVPKLIDAYVQGTVDGQLIDYNSATQSLNANGVTYENVFIYTAQQPFEIYQKIYYDTQVGLVGFDLSDGNQWRLIP